MSFRWSILASCFRARQAFFTVSSLLLSTLFWVAPSIAAPPQHQSDLEFKIPPTKIPFNVKDQPITIVASGLIAVNSSGRETATFKLDLNADLSDVQQNATALLASQLDKDDNCGEQIQIQRATITPAAPASLAVVELHYERRTCIKALGKHASKKLVSGNAVIQVKLTPAVEQNNTELKLVPEVGPIQADGSLGELLRSGSLGDMIREKIRNAILSAMSKGTNLGATIPPAAQPYARIENAQFKDGGGGRLLVVLAGNVRITRQQAQELTGQLKEKTHAVSHSAN
jgi:hypothetical protein